MVERAMKFFSSGNHSSDEKLSYFIRLVIHSLARLPPSNEFPLNSPFSRCHIFARPLAIIHVVRRRAIIIHIYNVQRKIDKKNYKFTVDTIHKIHGIHYRHLYKRGGETMTGERMTKEKQHTNSAREHISTIWNITWWWMQAILLLCSAIEWERRVWTIHIVQLFTSQPYLRCWLLRLTCTAQLSTQNASYWSECHHLYCSPVSYSVPIYLERNVMSFVSIAKYFVWAIYFIRR